jgi:RimJ/RimL family protein N-acetyltransferase
MVETARLLLRGWSAADVPALARMNGDREVMRYIGDGRVQSREDCERWIERVREQWATRGFGRWAAQPKSSGEMIGWVGLSEPCWLPEVMPSTEVGWRLARSHWGMGLATEGALASLAYAFGELDLKEVMSIYQAGNDASERVMEKIGMHHVRESVHPGLKIPIRIFAIGRGEWESLVRAGEGAYRVNRPGEIG